MLIKINLERNLKDKLVCENCALKKLHACSYRALIKRVTMFLKLLHENLMSLILKDKSLFFAYNEALYVFILLNDVI